MSNPFIWFDHRSEDASGAVTFYEKLLGWKRAAQSPPGMTAFGEEGERPWSGMTSGDSVPTGWLPYVMVEDIDASAEKAKTLGAKVLKERTQGPAGEFIVIQDPAGGAVALWQSS